MKKILLTLLLLTSSISFSAEMPELPNYQVVRELGEGAFGKVYEIQDFEGNRFALKTYKELPWNDDFAVMLGEYQREYQRGQTLDHPHIIKSHALLSWMEEGEEVHGVVLQYIAGKTLFATPSKSITAEEALKGIDDFIDSIQYALSLDLVHLDLHQGNLMISDAHELMIIDLASFFTFDEIFQFILNVKEEELEEEPTVVTEEEPTAKENKEKKLKVFFKKNMNLFKKIKTELKQNNPVDVKNNFRKAKSEPDRTPILASNFDKVVAICRRILAKSDMDRQDKLDLYSSMTRLSFEYQEDMEERLKIPAQYYLNQLKETIHSTNYSYD